MCHVKRKYVVVVFCICENKGANRLHGIRATDQGPCFRYIDSAIPLLQNCTKCNHVTIFCGCTVQFVSDLVRNPEDRFSQDAVPMVLGSMRVRTVSPQTSRSSYILGLYSNGQSKESHIILHASLKIEFSKNKIMLH